MAAKPKPSRVTPELLGFWRGIAFLVVAGAGAFASHGAPAKWWFGTALGTIPLPALLSWFLAGLFVGRAGARLGEATLFAIGASLVWGVSLGLGDLAMAVAVPPAVIGAFITRKLYHRYLALALDGIAVACSSALVLLLADGAQLREHLPEFIGLYAAAAASIQAASASSVVRPAAASQLVAGVGVHVLLGLSWGWVPLVCVGAAATVTIGTAVAFYARNLASGVGERLGKRPMHRPPRAATSS